MSSCTNSNNTMNPNDNYYSNNTTPQQQTITEQTFVEPQYQVYRFSYPSNYTVKSGGFLNEYLAFPYFTLANQDASTIIFLNDEQSLAYWTSNNLFGIKTGQTYMGSLVYNPQNYETHIKIALQRKGFQQIQIEGKANRTKPNGESRNGYFVTVKNQQGETMKGIVYANFLNMQGVPIIVPYEMGFLTKGNVEQVEREFENINNSFKADEAVANRLSQEFNERMHRAAMQNNGYVNDQILSIQANTNRVLASAQRTADIIVGNTQRYDPYTGQTVRMSDNGDRHYYTDGNGNVITNNDGTNPGYGYEEMKENY